MAESYFKILSRIADLSEEIDKLRERIKVLEIKVENHQKVLEIKVENHQKIGDICPHTGYI